MIPTINALRTFGWHSENLSVTDAIIAYAIQVYFTTA